MSKKKRDKSREAEKRRKAMRQSRAASGGAKGPPADSAPSATVSLPAMRTMERQMHALTGGESAPPTSLEKAQNLIWQAFESDDPERRCQLAQQALAICPDCADAYVLLAENAASRGEALDLYTRGVAAGERALGAQALQEYAGHFWGFLQTRPYMRAREGAHALGDGPARRCCKSFARHAPSQSQ